MKKIITLSALMLSLFATAQEVGDTMYVCRNDNVIERIAVSKIDSVTFVAPVLHVVSVSVEGGGACSITGMNGTSAEIITDKGAHDIGSYTKLVRYAIAPINRGDKLGEVIYTIDGKEATRVQILATETVKQKKKTGFFDLFTDKH